MYKGNTPILGARNFIIYLRSLQILHLFVTKKSSEKADDVSGKLNHMYIPSDEVQFVTSAVACASSIKSQNEPASVYVIVVNRLPDALQKSGCYISDKQAHYVVVGLERTI